ncbi:hypothetical protein [Puniceicoccus vermicola]|uniref:Uncharacterized protein n=1 Tax=Puniceicoccus vermicola TaxID=388746 RepID=A0A7X1B085_9BACT|nr:hypothetical protein [Puniceicoccus vermicola]MBC2603233.1 hypothetical protein [Puniceicoccus vermicola]
MPPPLSYRLRRVLAVGLAAFLCASTSLADEETLMMRGMMLAPSAEDLPEFFVRGSKGLEPLVFGLNGPGKPVRAQAANPLPLFGNKLDEAGEPVIARSVNVPPGATSILLVGMIVRGNAEFFAVPDDFVGARSDDWFFINATETTVALQVGAGTEPILLTPGAALPHRISAEKGTGATVAIIKQEQPGGDWKAFYSAFWPVYQDQRCIVLLYGDSKKIRVKNIFDSVEAESTLPD